MNNVIRMQFTQPSIWQRVISVPVDAVAIRTEEHGRKVMTQNGNISGDLNISSCLKGSFLAACLYFHHFMFIIHCHSLIITFFCLLCVCGCACGAFDGSTCPRDIILPDCYQSQIHCFADGRKKRKIKLQRSTLRDPPEPDQQQRIYKLIRVLLLLLVLKELVDTFTGLRSVLE